jgi:hypothetical protein
MDDLQTRLSNYAPRADLEYVKNELQRISGLVRDSKISAAEIHRPELPEPPSQQEFEGESRVEELHKESATSDSEDSESSESEGSDSELWHGL